MNAINDTITILLIDIIKAKVFMDGRIFHEKSGGIASSFI